MARRDIIVVGASAGGVEALRTLVGSFPGDLRAAVFVVVHMLRDAPSMMPQILEHAGRLPVLVPRQPLEIQSGHVYLPLPDQHLIVEPGGVHLSPDPSQSRTRPAIDPLFRSAATAYGPRVVGVVLTGNLGDGTAGLKAIKDGGGTAVVQDPEDAPFPGMPQSAIARVAVDHVLPLAQIGPLLVALARQEGAMRAQGHAVAVREVLEAGAWQGAGEGS